MTEFNEEQLKQIFNTVSAWTLDKSFRRAGEELLELALALIHYERSKIARSKVLDEMADVRIALCHLEFIFGNYQKQLDAKIAKDSNS